MPHPPAWLTYALLSALAASAIGVLGKVGMRGVDSNLATAVRSAFQAALLLAFATSLGLWSQVRTLNPKALAVIALTGVAGALSWLFYFRALSLAPVSKVAPIDKLSMPLGILLAVLLLGERPTRLNWLGILLIAAGAYLAAWPKK